MNPEHTSTLAIGVILAAACQNNDVPEHEPTLVTVTSGDDDGADTGPEGNGGADETTAGPTPQCWPDHSPADPSLYQCVGVGMGDLQWEEYALSWKAASLADPVVIVFPPQQREDPNVQACCEADAEAPAVIIGCVEDCARAACNLALERLQGKLADPPGLCGGACLDRFEDTITTWISFIEANYDECLRVARGGGQLAEAARSRERERPRSHRCGPPGELTLACTMDATQLPWETEHTCETGPNGATMAAWERWSCSSLQGAVELDGPLEIGAGTFEIVDAYVAWSDGSSMMISTDAASCVCTSCT